MYDIQKALRNIREKVKHPETLPKYKPPYDRYYGHAPRPHHQDLAHQYDWHDHEAELY